MEKFIIQGGVPLSGEIVPAGNKNAALPILAACLLTEDELVVRNVPRIRDVQSMLGLLERLGVKVAWMGENELRLQADQISGDEVDEELADRIRASFLIAGPLLARFGEARMPPPGGDTIGRRRLDAHLDAFRDLGAKVAGKVWIEISAPPDGLRPTRIFMDEPSVMGTENALLAAASAMKLATSMWSEHTSCSAPPRRSRPWTVITFDPMPSTCAPILVSRRARSCTCGSEAAFAIVVGHSVSAAASSAFSVPITEGSYM